LQVVDQAPKPQKFFGDQLSLGAVQGKLLAGLKGQAPHNKPTPLANMPDYDPNDPLNRLKPSNNQLMQRKLSIYDILKQKKQMRQELEAKAGQAAQATGAQKKDGEDREGKLVNAGKQQVFPNQSPSRGSPERD